MTRSGRQRVNGNARRVERWARRQYARLVAKKYAERGAFDADTAARFAAALGLSEVNWELVAERLNVIAKRGMS